MHRFALNSIANFVTTNFTDSCHVRPIVATYHFTHRCNLRCFFCAECGIEKNEKWENEGELSTEQAKKLLAMLSKDFAFLYITGGEPFYRGDAIELFEEIGRLPFKNVTVNSNLTLLPRIEQALDSINNLVASIDSVDPDRFDMIRGVKGMGARVLANLERAISLQESRKFKLHVNCVVTPTTIEDARKVMYYCVERGIKVGINAQNDVHGPIAGLRESSEFKKLVKEMMEIKERTHLITGTKMYYEQMFEFTPYTCYPFFAVRVNAKGDLAYPCDNLGQWVPNILQYGDWKTAEAKAIEMYGKTPNCPKSCQFQCYIEPSKIVRKPWLAFSEYL